MTIIESISSCCFASVYKSVSGFKNDDLSLFLFLEVEVVEVRFC